jgi:hypothetical protein
MPDIRRSHDVSTLTPRELKHARRELQALALARPGSPSRTPILTRLAAIDAALARLTGQQP